MHASKLGKSTSDTGGGPKWAKFPHPRVASWERGTICVACILGAVHRANNLNVLLLVLHARLSPDTSLDASLTTFPEDFLLANPGKQPDWALTSPSYKGALAFVKAALSVAKEGMALKLPISFLEP